MKWVFTHQDCPDGTGAAYSAWTKFGSAARYQPVSHEDDYAVKLAGVASGDEVYIADFCFPYDILAGLSGRSQVTILDHHVSAAPTIAKAREVLGMDAHYDVNRSGAIMAWEYFHPDTEAPMILRHVQDRDLWQFKLDNTREVMEALSQRGNDFEVWDRLAKEPEQYQQLVSEGALLLRVKRASIERILKNVRHVTIAGYQVPAVNSPLYASDIGNLLLERIPDAPFSATYSDAQGVRRWSLRSRTSGIDVAAIAQQFGGGGHQAASGFVQPLGDTVVAPSP